MAGGVEGSAESAEGSNNSSWLASSYEKLDCRLGRLDTSYSVCIDLASQKSKKRYTLLNLADTHAWHMTSIGTTRGRPAT